MYTLYIYNNDSHRLERYKLESYHKVPYTCFNTLYVSDFFSSTSSTIGWTTTAFLNRYSESFKGNSPSVSLFRRIFEGGYVSESMHYAGLAADSSFIPKNHTFPFCDQNHLALYPAGYPKISYGDIGVFVFILQDALSSLGFCEGGLDGFFGFETQKALSSFCKYNNISFTSECNSVIWKSLTFQAAGCGFNEHIKYFNSYKTI